jgi:predicted deacylase
MQILGNDIGYGKTVLNLDIAKLPTRSSLEVPVIIQRSRKPGPTLLLVAGIHGDEVNGIEIVRQVIKKKLNKPQRGTVICIPTLNVFGFLNQSREYPDGRDLNRVFPGSPKGSLASRFAHFMMSEIIPQVDYIIDFHTGGADRFNYTQIRIGDDPELLELAKVFGCKFIYLAKKRDKSLRDVASKLGKKVLLFEGGKSLDLNRDVTRYGIAGTLRIMQHIGMIKEMPLEYQAISESPIIVQSSSWVRAKHSGMFRSDKRLGSFVNKGDILGSISDPYGSFERKVKAPRDGFIICLNHAPIINQGDALVHLSDEIDLSN